MLQHDGAVLAAIEHGVLEIGLGFLGPVQQVQQPAVGVQVGGVVGLQLDGPAAHLERLAELAALQREVVGVVVEHGGPVGIGQQGLLVGLVGLLAVLHLLVVHVAGDRERFGEVLVVVLAARQVRHHAALREHRFPVLLDVAHPQLEQLDVVIIRMQIAVQVHQAVDGVPPDPVERGVDVVHQHGEVVALHLRPDVFVADEILQSGEERREVPHAARYLDLAVLGGGVFGIQQEGLVVVVQRQGVLQRSRLGVSHHREGVGVVVQRRRHLDQLFHILRGADLIVLGVVQRRDGVDVPGVGRIRLRGLQEMLLGGVEVAQGHLAQPEVVIDGIVLRILLVQLREHQLCLRILPFGIGGRGGQEQVVARLRMKGAAEQAQGSI